MASKEKKLKSEPVTGEKATVEAAKAHSEGARDLVHGVLKNHEVIESNKDLINALKSRFEAHPERHEGVNWVRVEKALAAHPEKIAVLKKLEEAGGEPDVLRAKGESIIFCDFSLEIPKNRKNLDYYEAEEMAKEFGAELMDEIQYLHLQDVGKFDTDCFCWLKSPEDILETYRALYGCCYEGVVRVEQRVNRGHDKNFGFRCVLKVLRDPRGLGAK